jgi:hypothetical protein
MDDFAARNHDGDRIVAKAISDVLNRTIEHHEVGALTYFK